MQKTDFKNIFILWIILTFFIILTYAHHGSILIDNGREAYYPTQVLLGKILYKDIFNIYGPFAYQFNAILFKIFGINLNVLYLSGCACAYSIITLIYLISKKFLSTFLSFSISFFTLIIGITSLDLFSYIFPYCYGMLYGLVAFLFSLLFLIRYQQNSDKTFYLYISSFFAGLCFVNKYDFLPYIFVILYAIIKIKPLKFKEYLFTALSLFSMPLLCFGFLFLQGLTINDILLSAQYIKNLTQSKTLDYFYSTQGIYFRKGSINLLLLSFISTVFPLSCFVYGAKNIKKISSIIILLLSVFLMIKFVSPVSFAFVPLLCTILLVINFKTILKNEPIFLLTISALSVSLKIFWGLATLNYGMFYAGILILTLLTIILKLFENKNIELNKTAIGIYLIIASILLGYPNLFKLKSKTYPIKTDKGVLYTILPYYESTTELIKYIKTNTKKTDKIVILPEGAMINFFTDRQSDDFFISLIPPYVETFGEDNIIKHFDKEKPDYIIFNNWEAKDYYYKYICTDYAVSFCNYVAANYTQEKVIPNFLRYTIFKLNR